MSQTKAGDLLQPSLAPPDLAPPSLAVVALNRLAYGPRPDDIAAFDALGSSDAERITAWLDAQLDPDSLDDTVADQKIADAGFLSVGMPLADIFEQFHRNYYNGSNGDQSSTPYVGWRPVMELQRLTLIRALFSERQLHEMMIHFWHDHFSVQGWEYIIQSMIMPMHEEAIRPNALGNFRVLLEAVSASPAMLYYLDNYTNSSAGPNENFARELFELHTLGEENYLGSGTRQSDVEGFPNEPVGYVDDDVYEATRAFTGWTFHDAELRWDAVADTGEFYYRSDDHDRFQKIILGQFIEANQADMRDGQQVFDILVAHPGTARHIAGKLCRRFVSDDPPQTLIDSTAELFTATITAPDQIAQLIRHIATSDEFGTTWGEKLRRPFHSAVSALRAMAIDMPLVLGEEDDPGDTLMWLIGRSGHDIYAWQSPDGYPDNADYWLNSNSLFQRWFISIWASALERPEGGHYFDMLGAMPDETRSATEIVDFWVDRLLGFELSAESRQQLIDFMADSLDPDTPLPLDSDTSTRERAMSLAGLIMMTPEAQWK